MSRSQLLALALALVAGCSPRPETPDPDAPAGRVQPAAAYGAVNALDPNGPPIPDPPVAASRDGVLELTLTAAPAVVTVAGRTFRSNVYNGSYIPPVLRVWRGDDVRITFINAVDSADILIDEPQPSNLHYHGMAISPLEPADNIYISIPLRAAAPGDTVMTEDGGHAAGLAKSSPVYEYRWSVPANHPQGPHWYHPHRHHFAEPQVLSGMSGMLLVEGMVQEQFPELAGARRRILVLKDIILPGDADTLPHTKTINGILGGTIRMAPGAVEIWEIGNVGADAYFDLTVDGHRVWVLTRDGNILERPEPALNIFLPPASRATVAIQAGAAGLYGIRSLEVDTGPMGDPNPHVLLATLVVEGTPVDHRAMADRLARPAANPASIHPRVDEIRSAPIARRRRIVYSETPDGETFFLNGRQFDPDRVDAEATVGDVEEWTLVNETGERHTFHIHQLDFLVISINGNDEDATGLRDNIDLPYRDPVTGEPGVVTVIIPFTDPTIVGRFPFHCHILEHEDGGMMATMEVRPRPAEP